MEKEKKKPEGAAVQPEGVAVHTECTAMDTVQALCAKKKTDAAVYAGLMAMQGWLPGTSVTEASYDAAAKTFCSSSAAGGRKRC